MVNEIKENKIFFKGTEIIQSEVNKKWENTDTRRKLFRVRFSDGSVWYPKNIEIDEILQAKKITFEHNIQYPNIDKPKQELDAVTNLPKQPSTHMKLGGEDRI